MNLIDSDGTASEHRSHAQPTLTFMNRLTIVLRLLTLGTALLCAPALHAQDGIEPWVSYSPLDGMFTTGTVQVSVRFRDETSLDMSSKSVLLNGVSVTGSFSFSPPAWGTGQESGWMTSTGTATLTLQPGPNVVSASVCDQAGNCSNPWSVTYTYAPGQQGVRVTPDGGTVQVPANSTQTRTFHVKNTWSASSTFALRASCREAWTGASLSGCSAPASVTVDGGDSAAVTVTYPSGPAGREMVVRLSARSGPTVEDAGWVDVTTAGAGTSQVAPTVVLVDLNQGLTSDRSECVTVAVAPGAAYECGDLRVAHALPAQRTHGRTWAPALLYNSQHAHPMPTVYADVTIPATASVPDSVKVVVSLQNGTVHQARYPGSEFVPGIARRVAVQWDGLNTGSGVYPYGLQVTSHYGTVSRPSSTYAGTLVVVNRHLSPFGAGWWLAGWERLECIDCTPAKTKLLWIGGDGSTQIFERVGPGVNTWTAHNPSAPRDTLTLSGSVFTRPLPGGGRIELDASGFHVRTVNRLGQTTHFAHTAGRLDTIRAPVPAGAGARRWDLLYGGGHLLYVQAITPGVAARQVELGYAGGNLPMTAIVDPDGKRTTFTYSTGTYSPRIRRIVTRDSTRYEITYDAAGKLSSVRLWMGTTAETPDDIIQRFQAGESRGVGTSVALSQAYTKLDGPRDDVADQTYLWLTNRGAPRRIRNPEGVETILNRTEAHFPALVTEVRSSNARGDSMLVQSSADYHDTYGLLLRSVTHNPRGDLRNDTTIYTWNTRWRLPATVATYSGGLVSGTVHIAYDASNGNPLWQQVGSSASRRVRYTYYTSGAAAGQLASLRYPHPSTGVDSAGGIDSLYYDGLGNLRGTRSPLGIRTVLVRDGLGRDSVAYAPIDASLATTESNVIQYGAWSRVSYDVLDRPWKTVSYGPGRTHAPGPENFQPAASPAEQLTVLTTYDNAGRPLTVTRQISPNPAELGDQVTAYTYDRAGRKITEQLGMQLQRFAYDKAGNVTTWTTARSLQVTSQYDVMGRVVKRGSPAVTYIQALCSAPGCTTPFPYHPNNGTGYRIPADTSYFRYDLLGRMVYAQNNDAIVARSYYPNGLLRTDSLKIRQYGGMLYTAHQYGLEYRYDALGRLTRLLHPSNLQAQADSFAYNTITGSLAYARDRHGNVFTFYEDLMGRPRSVRMPGSVIDSTVYDLDGRVVRRLTGGTSNPGLLQNDSLIYDARGKLVRVQAAATYQRPASTYVQWYSGLGNLTATDWDNVSNAGWDREEYGMDALGNIVTRRPHEPGDLVLNGYYPYFQNTLDPVYGRVTAMERVNAHPQTPYYRDESFRNFDRSGNVSHAGQEIEKELAHGREILKRVESRAYYDADEKLRVFQQLDFRPDGTRNGTWEEYRYDPLGRRVLVRSNEEGLCAGAGFDCTSAITRFIWAGDQILWELRAPGGSTSNLEATTGTGMKYGRVSYLHAGRIDRPLSIWKEGVGSIIPHQNWRGQFARGTFPNGASSDCLTYPPMNCVPVPWPGWQTTATHAGVSEPLTTGYEEYWTGSLTIGMRDASGQIYMRNRYYDPATGQFTQPDPIGLAGGLNAYGFAAGDPISYSDPYGLCPKFITGRPCTLQDAANFAAGFGDAITFGATAWIRQNTPGGDGVEYNSGLYAAGLGAGTITIIVLTEGAATAAVPRGTLAVSAEAHRAQQAAAVAGRSWTTQRRALWRAEAASEGAVERWGARNVERMTRGRAPQVRNPRTGQMESVELHHTPTPQREGGTRVRPVTPDQHRAADPYRHE